MTSITEHKKNSNAHLKGGPVVCREHVVVLPCRKPVTLRHERQKLPASHVGSPRGHASKQEEVPPVCACVCVFVCATCSTPVCVCVCVCVFVGLFVCVRALALTHPYRLRSHGRASRLRPLLLSPKKRTATVGLCLVPLTHPKTPVAPVLPLQHSPLGACLYTCTGKRQGQFACS
jgi:hypothetical protein